MSTRKTAEDVAPSQFAGAGLTVTAEAIERLIGEAEYKQHPYGRVWQPFDLDLFRELVGDVGRRGLDREIPLYKGMVLDGWHGYLACLATKTQPRFVEFPGTDLEAAERVNASGIRRQSRPEQRYASFLLLCDACPDFKAKVEALKEKGAQQQEAGAPLSTGGQRVDVVGAKAAAAGVGRSTAAKVEAVQKRKPEAVAEIAGGKTSANKELQKLKNDKGHDGPKGEKPEAVAEIAAGNTNANKERQKLKNDKGLDGPKGEKPDFKRGDVVYVVTTQRGSAPSIKEWKITSVKKDGYICTDGTPGKGKRIARHEAETHERARQEWKDKLKELIEDQLEEVQYLKERLRQGPKIEPVKITPGR
jgi:hypothetical protein